MGTIAAPQHSSGAFDQWRLPPLPVRATMVRRVTRALGIRLLAWASRPARDRDRESTLLGHESELARAQRERHWHAEACNGPLR